VAAARTTAPVAPAATVRPWWSLRTLATPTRRRRTNKSRPGGRADIAGIAENEIRRTHKIILF